MALEPNALTTLATVKAELGISGTDDDTTLERLINQASAYIATLTDRQLHWDAAAVDDVRGLGKLKLVLPRTPLSSITSIVYTDAGGTTETLAATAYAIDDAGAGVLRRIDGGAWTWTGRAAGTVPRAVAGTAQRRWRVTYAAGWVTPQQAADDGALTRDLPFDLEALCIAGVVAQYRAQGADPTVTGRRLLEASISYSASRSTYGALTAAIDPTHPTILAYRRRWA